MKRFIVVILALIMLFSFSACSSQKQEIVITIPAGSMESYVFSEEIFIATKDEIIVHAGAGYADTSVTIKTEKVTEENAYEPIYLTHGMPVKIDVEKGGWFKIGISIQNLSSNHDIAVSVYLQNIEIVE